VTCRSVPILDAEFLDAAVDILILDAAGWRETVMTRVSDHLAEAGYPMGQPAVTDRVRRYPAAQIPADRIRANGTLPLQRDRVAAG
jgi:hypothetical protein